MNREELPRIRLKVVTNLGINILCTALKTWKVIEWIPHIQEAYREVKEEQEDDENSKQRFIRAIRIKKQDFYIANSQCIGDIFDDNDQVQCEITFPQVNKADKQTKNKDKSHKKTDVQKQAQLIAIVEQANQQMKLKNAVVEEVEPKPKKKVKIDKAQRLESQNNEFSYEKTQKKIDQQKNVKENQARDRQAESNKKNHKLLEDKQEKKQKQQQIMKNIDLAKLKSKIKLPTQILNSQNARTIHVYSVDKDSDSEQNN